WSDAEEEEESGDFLEVIGKVLPAHRGARSADESRIAERFSRDAGDVLGHRGVVHCRWIAHFPRELQLAAAGQRDPATSPLDRFADELARRLVERARGPFNLRA